MAIQIPSGLITSASGAAGAELIAFPQPVVLVGALGASASGNNTITHYSGALNVNISGGSLVTNIISSGGTVLTLPAYQSGTLVALSGINATVISSSGGAAGVLAFQPVGYSYQLVSGAGIFNIHSGAGFLHTINVTNWCSGGVITVYDSLSGAAGNAITGFGLSGATAASNQASSLRYDILFTSGLVVSSSGVTWNASVAWRTATS